MNHLTTTKLSQCFRALKVSPGDPWGAVKKSYYLLARQYHPDLHPSNLAYENKLKEVTRAFKVLETHYKIQESNRSRGDREVSRNLPGQARMNGGPPSPKNESWDDPAAQRWDHSLNTAEKSGRWNHWFRSFRVQLTKLERKIFLLDTRKNIRIHPHTAVHGGMVKMRKGKNTFHVKIPSGSWRRMSLRIPERGETSLFGKKRGDLLLNIQVIHPERLAAGGLRFYYELRVPREKIKASRMLTLDSVHGPIKFVLPRKATDGQKFVLKFQPDGKTSPSSSHIVKVQLV